VESTLGQAREDLHKRILTFFRVHIRPIKDLGSITHEHASQEEIDEIHLENGVEEVHQVTNEEYASVPVVLMEGFLDIFDESFARVFPLIDVQGTTSKAIGDLLHPFVFINFPEVMRQIKHDSLEEKDKWDPLIVGMTDKFVFIIIDTRSVIKAWLNALVGIVCALSSRVFTRDGEGGHDPTIGIENIAGNISTDAVNGLSNQIVGSHQNGGEKQNGCTGPVVELEKGRVNVRFVSLVTGLD